MNFFQRFVRPVFFRLDPENAHNLVINGLKAQQKVGFSGCDRVEDPRLRCMVAGLDFPNIIGLAAGFDKNAQVSAPLMALGFGFVEVGTLTPKPQLGNPRPRLFRLEQDRAIINRMGFNNDGHEAAYARLCKRQDTGIIGVNIGANKESSNRIADYVVGVATFYSVADYFTVNISSPNTPGLRDLQKAKSLEILLGALTKARQEAQGIHGFYRPIFLKIAPDLDESALDEIAAVALASSLDGLIISNTALARPLLLEKRKANESGGLSGRPLFQRATITLAKMRQRLGKNMPLIGVGGVCDAQSALEKIKAGADLVQLYSAMVYQGPSLPQEINRGLLEIMDKEGVGHISEYRDQACTEWAAHVLEN
ncbi:quinone-dependent dihydroorotate dehydrogenase [Bartonella sp. DGB2]|uniref:quinone-dependent dihydroorotate dehydrogenase n=1 Tax=Bartonella sp. DGB2 TaxID=3388426 RepID=UPI00398FFDCB